MIADPDRRAVRRTLDRVRRTYQDLEEMGLPEDHMIDQITTVLGAMADALAALGRAVEELDR